MKKFCLALCLSFFAAIMLLSMSACSSRSLHGTYEMLTYDRNYVLEKAKDGVGVFEVYENGKKQGDPSKREVRTWTVEEDVLTLNWQNGDTEYYKIYDDILIRVDDSTSEPELAEYIAPKGKTFDWECGRYTFYKDGSCHEYSSYSGMSRSGDYYVEDNIIYAKLDYQSQNIYGYEPKYEPLFYIYNGDYIAEAYDVLVRK